MRSSDYHFSLPKEILRQVALHLDDRDRRVAKVLSKYWYQSLTELVGAVCIISPPPSESAWKGLFARRPKIKSIRFEVSKVDPLLASLPLTIEALQFDQTHVTAKGLGQLVKHPYLKELDVRDCPDLSLDELALPRLRSLALSSSVMERWAVDQLKNAMKGLVRLGKERIFKRFNVEIADSGPGFQAVQGSQQRVLDDHAEEVERLYFEGFNAFAIPAPKVFEYCRNLRLIRCVDGRLREREIALHSLKTWHPFKEQTYPDHGTQRLGWFSKLTSLRTLDLAHWGRDNQFDQLSKLTALTGLVAFGSPQTQQAQVLSTLGKLQVLYFRPADGQSLTYLGSLSNLTELGIDSPEGVAPDVKSLTRLSDLQRLWLNHPSINVFPYICKLPLSQLTIIDHRASGRATWQIPFFQGLKSLSLSIGNLEHHQIEAICRHTQLRTLALDTFPGEKITLLGKLTDLEDLYVTVFGKTIDCSELSALHKLRRLEMRQLVQLSGSSYGCHSELPQVIVKGRLPASLREVQLHRLSFDNGTLHAISQLRGLRTLVLKPQVPRWRIPDLHLTWLKGLTRLEKLSLQGIGLMPYGPLRHLQNLRVLKWGLVDGTLLPEILSLSKVRNLRLEPMKEVSEDDIKELKALPNLWSVDLKKD